jgi:hypothetical protein
MKSFTIDTENNITAFATEEEAAATTTTPFDSFASKKELAALAASWPAGRLVAIWNSLPGVKAVRAFKGATAAADRIWAHIQTMGETEKPKSGHKAKVGAQVPKGAPRKAKSDKKATAAKKAPTAKKAAKAQKNSAPRVGTKTSQVVAMLQRKNGATLPEIMNQMGWQRHTVRGFMAGAMKKAGYTVESFKSEKGERTYRINQ